MPEPKKTKKEQAPDADNSALQIAELTLDLQRTRADFENYRKRADLDKSAARESGQAGAILKLLPVIDNIERAIGYTPEELKDNAWVRGVVGLTKNLEKSLDSLNLARIDAKPGTVFSPDIHEANKRLSLKICRRDIP
jgi:molecular chaperone GrpE